MKISRSRNLKRALSLALLALIALSTISLLSSCSGEETEVLNVYNWGEYISDGSEGTFDTNAEFEAWYYKTYGKKVKVNYSVFASNEDMYAKLKSGAVSYDVVIPSDYMIEQMIAEDMLVKLDFSNIPNFEYIAEKYVNPGYDPTNEYSVPYTAGMVGIIYNTKYVSGTPTSWDLLWDEAYAGKILTFNNPRDAFGTAMYRKGIDVNTSSESDWREAFEQLQKQKPLIQSYVMDEIFNKMKNGSAAIAPYYAGDFFTMYADNEDLAFYYPEEGTNIFVDAMCVPKGSENKELAEIYINYMLSEEAAVANAEYICYASPNKLVIENEAYREAMNELHPDAYDILYGHADTVKTSYYSNLSNETRAVMNSLWEDLKIENSIGCGVYVLCGVIVAAMVCYGIFVAVRNKKRARYDDIDEADIARYGSKSKKI